MTFAELVIRNRSCRRFDAGKPIAVDTLRELVDLARQTPSGGNLQPLKYVVSSDPELNEKIYSTLKWAAYLKDWAGPDENERPTGYVVILHDTAIAKNVICDHGIAAQTIMLGAVEKGLAGCMLASVNKVKLKEILGLPESLDIFLVLALGAPAETQVMEDLGADGDVKYWRDDKGVHHVPKRSLGEVLVSAYGK